MKSELLRIENQRMGEERALYGSRGVHLISCAFDGEEDGESALKESSDILLEHTFCNLRYPFWHDRGLELVDCELTSLCRAALWYSRDVKIRDSKLHGIKALRECARVEIGNCDIISPEFGWSTVGLTVSDSRAESEYFLLRARNYRFTRVQFHGKYSFQYTSNGELSDCVLDTKDAFWHAKNVVLRDCVVKGEYLGWYSDGLTLIRCKISGTQPFCYCKNLRLVDCEMEGTDLAFERSSVDAVVLTPIVSVKNPRQGSISAPAVGALIMDDPLAKGTVILRRRE